MAESTEPRASTAVLTAPAFATRNSGTAMHAANRHVERWAPEAGADRVRSLRNLGFVDRLIAPWLETAQRSSTLRMFSHMARGGNPPEREPNAVSWIFPRPWYQDELDWMAAARQVPSQTQQSAAPTMLTTRGTYVAPQQAVSLRPAMPAALYEHVAPSLSIAQSAPAMGIAGVGYGGNRADVYSPLVSFASAQAAQMIGRIAPSVAATTKSPMLRDVLSTILARATTVPTEPSRISQQAPELVTPPAPRAHAEVSVEPTTAPTAATRLATQMAEQRAQIVDLQRVAQQAAVREIVARQAAQPARVESAPSAPSTRTDAAARPETAHTDAAARTETARTDAAARTETARIDAAARAEIVRAEIVRAELARSEATAGSEIARAEEARAVTVRGEAARTEVARSEQARGEAARLEERIAQRVAERRQGPRLHDEARAEAAQHARAAELPVAAGSATPARTETPSAITAAIAAMPVEIASYLSARPRHAAQAIAELDTAMRAVELLAHGADGNRPFEATRGPRLVMPAGIGGLVATLDHAKPPQAQQAAPLAPQRRELRVPTLSFATPSPEQTARTAATTLAPTARPAIADFRVAQLGAAQAPTSAFMAATSMAPVALSHVAWADRWLARFAGAAPRSLDAFAAATTGGMQALVDAAPSTVFVAPMFDIERPDAALAQSYSTQSYSTQQSSAPSVNAASPSMGAVATAPASGRTSTPTTAAPGPTRIPSPPQVIRYDDNAETPDDVFAAISSGATTQRRAATATPTAPTASIAPTTTLTPTPTTASYADAIAHSSPVAPNAGMAAQLAASPFAPALRHLLPLTASASFDVRALFGAGLSTTYLAGLLAPSTHQVDVAAAQTMAPAWARWSQPTPTVDPATPIGERAALDFDPTYVAPELPSIGALAIEQAQQQLAQHQVHQETVAQTAVIAEVAAQLVAAQVTAPDEIATIARRVGIAPAELATAVARASSPAAAAQARAELAQLAAAPTTTLRTALLSWDVDPAAQPGAASQLGATTTFAAPSSAAPRTMFAAQSMIDAINLPLLGDGATDASSSWAGPGMIAERARSWSVAQERSSADLSYDFVTPELVLAARVYGLGPAEAAQAARLAVAGPGHITAMASAVDRTFVQAMAIEADRRQSITTAYPSGGGEIAAVIAALRPGAAVAASPQASQTTTTGQPRATQATPSSFGVERRMPRGAFLWPSASVGALGLSAAAPDGEQSMSVAALELLAAQAVAELGTYAAFADGAPSADRTPSAEPGSERDVSAPLLATQIQAVAAARALAAQTATLSPEAGAAALYQRGESSEADVLASAAALVPMARRARFDALYIALSQSPSGRTWSPAARAARAFALAGHGGDDVQGLTAQERAATAWDVLPVVYASGVDTLLGPDRADRARASSQRGGGGAGGARSVADRRATNLEQVETRVDTRPGLANLSARAGEALGSYVSPASFTPSTSSSSGSSASSSSSSSSSSGTGAVLRAPTAAQELVRTGRPAGRHGGGETEIPTWFEAAARKMLADRTPVSEGVSLAELTLVQAAAPQQIAASEITPSNSASGAPAHAASDGGSPHEMNVEKLSQDVYRHIMSMLDAARARNGES